MSDLISDIAEYSAKISQRYGILESFCFRNLLPPGTGPFGYHTVELRLRHTIDAPSPFVDIFCHGVSDIKFGDLHQSGRYCIEIRSIRDRQLDGLHYEVLETEEQAFSFLCDRFEFAESM